MKQKRGFVLAAIVLLALGLAMPASAVPQWARRYNVSCSTCHAWPGEQLTATGLDFLRRGHRLKGDGFDKDLTHLLSGHVEWQYDFAQGATNQFNKPEFHLHAGGALAASFSGYLDVNVNNDVEAGYLQFTKEHGDSSYFTVRGGKFNPTLIRNYAGGLAVSASIPLVFSGTTLGSNPFTVNQGRLGVDIGGRMNYLFVQGGVVNGEDVPGQAAVNHHKDYYGTAEVTAPDGVSGVGLYYYHGGYDLGDPAVGPVLRDRYYRSAVFANFTRTSFRVAAAYLTGKDQVQTLQDRKIHGYYALVEVRPGGWWVPFARYDDATTELETGKDHVRQGRLGVALELYMTDSTSARVALELARSSDTTTHTNTNSGLVNLVWAF
ncbi:MAG TPA: hypothetical protein VHQ90_05140 [Thermoanaerobaculia bacterium]|nr:hypothetical protein [Thermoanaerobaculia bacterium]